MKNIDLITKLQQLSPDMEVMVDQTRDGSTMFKFVELNFVDEVETAVNEKIIVLSPLFYETTEEFESP